MNSGARSSTIAKRRSLLFLVELLSPRQLEGAEPEGRGAEAVEAAADSAAGAEVADATPARLYTFEGTTDDGKALADTRGWR